MLLLMLLKFSPKWLHLKGTLPKLMVVLEEKHLSESWQSFTNFCANPRSKKASPALTQCCCYVKSFFRNHKCLYKTLTIHWIVVDIFKLMDQPGVAMLRSVPGMAKMGQSLWSHKQSGFSAESHNWNLVFWWIPPEWVTHSWSIF